MTPGGIPLPREGIRGPPPDPEGAVRGLPPPCIQVSPDVEASRPMLVRSGSHASVPDDCPSCLSAIAAEISPRAVYDADLAEPRFVGPHA